MNPAVASLHVVIFLGSSASLVLVPRALVSFFYLSRVTRISIGAFFFTCAITHLALAFDAPYAPITNITATCQALSLMAFVPALIYDLRVAVRRLTAAYAAVGIRYGSDVMRVVRDTFRVALATRTTLEANDRRGQRAPGDRV